MWEGRTPLAVRCSRAATRCLQVCVWSVYMRLMRDFMSITLALLTLTRELFIGSYARRTAMFMYGQTLGTFLCKCGHVWSLLRSFILHNNAETMPRGVEESGDTSGIPGDMLAYWNALKTFQAFRKMCFASVKCRRNICAKFVKSLFEHTIVRNTGLRRNISAKWQFFERMS